MYLILEKNNLKTIYEIKRGRDQLLQYKVRKQGGKSYTYQHWVIYVSSKWLATIIASTTQML